ncbi:MAG: hypothetical protein KC496_16665 [Anaerolineae bacterium]|nr:hypothetical protein [Anaerolineae bacterium]
MTDETPRKEAPMPPPPEQDIDPDRVEAAEERWQECPLRDCKRDSELLYEDFYLRDVRTNRLMCSACAVRTEVGYLAREVVKATDDRFFTGTVADDLIVLGVMLIGSVIAHTISMFIGFFYISFFIGAGVAGAIAPLSRRLTGGRVTRRSQYFATGGIILGALLAPTVFYLLRAGVFIIDVRFLLDISLLLCAAGMMSVSWGIFLRRI